MSNATDLEKFEENYINQAPTNTIVNKMPEKKQNQSDKSYEITCNNVKKFGGYNRAQRRNIKKNSKIRTMEDANFLATIFRQQNDKAKEEAEKENNKEATNKPKFNPKHNFVNKKAGISGSNMNPTFAGVMENGVKPEIVGVTLDEEKIKEQIEAGNI